MKELTARHPDIVLLAVVALSTAIVGAACHFFFSQWRFGVNAGMLIGICVGGLITRKARPVFAVPLLLIMSAAVLLMLATSRAAGN